MSVIRPIDRWFIDSVLPHASAYHAQARRWAKDAGSAHDIVQEAYARIIGLESWRELSNPKAYTMMTVRNIAFDRLRQAQVLPFDSKADVYEVDAVDDQPDAFARVAAQQELELVCNMIETLPPQCRAVVKLRKLQDCSPREIAEKLAISVSTVEKHLVKGLRLIMTMRASQAEADPKNDPSRDKSAPQSGSRSGKLAGPTRRRNC